MSRCVLLLCMLTWSAVAARYYPRQEITRGTPSDENNNSPETTDVGRGWAVRAIYVPQDTRGSQREYGYPVTTYYNWDSDERDGQPRGRYGHHSGGRSWRRGGPRRRGRHHGGRHRRGGRSDRYNDVSWDPYDNSAELYGDTDPFDSRENNPGGYPFENGGRSLTRDNDDNSSSEEQFGRQSGGRSGWHRGRHGGGRSGRSRFGGRSGRHRGRGRSGRYSGGRSDDFDWLYGSL